LIIGNEPFDIKSVYDIMKELQEFDLSEIESNDIGFFGRAFKDKYENEFWGKYDVFLPMAFTAITTGILWLIAAIMDIYKYINMHWSLACHVLFLNIS